jgi:antimicrobial peptide system SdpA family protein
VDAAVPAIQPDELDRCQRGFRFTAGLLVTALVLLLVAQLPAGWAPGWVAHGRRTAHSLWPQSWSFFSDVARSHVLVAYRIGPQGAVALATRPELDRAHLWGISRTSESAVIEAAELARLVPAAQWLGCDAVEVQACAGMRTGHRRQPLLNRSRYPTLCGPIVFTVERPAHWPVESGGRTGRVVLLTAVAEVACVS